MKGFKILDFADIESGISHLHKHGWDSGLYAGFPIFQNHYNIVADGCTDWTGYPSSGKTELCLEMLFNMSEWHSHKHLLFVPDIGRSIEVMVKLIHKLTGQTFIKRYNNFITIKKAFDSCAWLLEHFKIIHKTDSKAKITPIELFDFAVNYKKDNDLNSIMIDSWKDLHHDYKAHGGSYATYLSEILPIRNDVSERNKIHIHTIIHPKNPAVAKDRSIAAPSTFDMEGGAQWANSGKCIISVHRENYDNNITDIYFRKIKPESIGRNTHKPTCLQFDIIKSRYYYLDTDGETKVYASKNRPQKEQKEWSF